MAPKGDEGIAQVCHRSDYWFITLLLEHKHTHTHRFSNSHTVSRRWGNWGDNQIHLSCPPLPFPSFSTLVEIEHSGEDYWLEIQELGGRQQMRPDCVRLPAVSKLGLRCQWAAALGTRAGVAGEKARRVNLGALALSNLQPSHRVRPGQCPSSIQHWRRKAMSVPCSDENVEC